MTSQHHFVGYHGTDASKVSSIQQFNFNKSTEDDDWLGHGVYFFVEGISCPVENASEWAVNQAFKKKYAEYAVLQADIVGIRLLDTTTLDGLKAFNTIRNALIRKHNSYFHPARNIYEDDRLMWNMVAKALKLDIIIHNLYIKDNIQRRKRIASNVPNTTVICVKEPSSVVLGSIQVACKGRVK